MEDITHPFYLYKFMRRKNSTLILHIFIPFIYSFHRMATTNVSQPNAFIKKFQHLAIHSRYDIVFSARNGVSTKVFYDLAEVTKMPEKTLARLLNLSPRTISNYKEQKKKLEPIYSEHLLKLISLFEKGEELFGTVDQFNQWLQKPFWNSRELPFDWLITPGGVDLLMNEMDRLAEGYPV